MSDADGGSKVILTTFAGRKDRMELLTWYANTAIERGIVDEWHVWDFTRQRSDALWLRQQFPSVRLTPSEGDEYFSTRSNLHLGTEPVRYELSVAATNDVIIGLRRVLGSGDSYEIVLGGWHNGQSAIRAFPEVAQVTDTNRRGAHAIPVSVKPTPGLLPEWGFSEIALDVAPDGLRAIVDGVPTIDYRGKIEPGAFEVLYRSSHGCDAEWRFCDRPGRGNYLFLSGPPKLRVAPSMPRYMSFYQHYTRHAPSYANDVFVKCDDDIVFIDLDRLREFIAFRRANAQHFIISANVVNNGVCAYFQQQHGMIPQPLLQLELPPKGLGGNLHSSSQRAEVLHRYFLENIESFRQSIPHEIIWNDRMSINFVSWLGTDLVHIPDTMFDDEDYLCYQARLRSRKKTNVIYWPLLVSHLSFYTQDESLNVGALLAGYRDLAHRLGVHPSSEPVSLVETEACT